MEQGFKFKNIFSFNKKRVIPVEQKQFSADYITNGNYRQFAVTYNGEKNLGEIGPVKNYRIDYDILRIRSWQSYLESEITQTVIGRFSTWVIGLGLKLQCEPAELVLESEGITIDHQAFCSMVEARFNIFRKSISADFSNMINLDLIASTAHINSIIGGDVLVVLRYIDDAVKIQLIDGAHVQSPFYGTEFMPQVLDNGNRIMNGVEVNERNEHVAYHVRTNINMTFERIPARGPESGLQMAFLVYGLNLRLDNIRGLPLISTVLETLKKLERYKEATVASAEEVAKVAYQVVHKEFSTGENPLAKSIMKAHDINASGDLPTDISGKEIANNIAATTNKQAFNMPVGSETKTLNQSNGQINFKDFYTTNIDLICASLGIPPNVAMSKYDSNFSASRAALKDWEHTLKVIRTRFGFQFYQKIYNFWLEIEILKNKINAPGYLMAKLKADTIVLDSYRNARFVGAPVPHIDPLKEVNAERMKLGVLGAALPLTTLEAATEVLNGGESEGNMKQFSKELKEAEELDIEMPVTVSGTATQDEPKEDN